MEEISSIWILIQACPLQQFGMLCVLAIGACCIALLACFELACCIISYVVHRLHRTTPELEGLLTYDRYCIMQGALKQNT